MTDEVKNEMGQRLVRGTPVMIANSFGKADLRGANMIVASKGTVRCNGKGRCAGDWCVELAVFVTDPSTVHDEKEMGWRGGTTKVCLTHLRDTDGHLILPPPALRIAQDAMMGARQPQPTTTNKVVTWEELARAVSSGNHAQVALLARRLKQENEELKVQMIEAQAKVIVALQAR